MSMLAERRRKTKYVLYPGKNPIWNDDSSGMKFGKKLMEKMGWNAGKGLGSNEQGIQEPIKVHFKHDNKGMGFKGHDNSWIQHQDEFNNILSSFSNNSEAGMEESNVKSLEERSKNSKSRMHYKKFTRGKDLSRYSQNDLDCILGIYKKKDPEVIEQADEEDTMSKGDTETSFGVTTIQGGSVQDYFKQKYQLTGKKLECKVYDRYKIEDDEPGYTGFGFGYKPEQKECDVETPSAKKSVTFDLSCNMVREFGLTDLDTSLESNAEEKLPRVMEDLPMGESKVKSKKKKSKKNTREDDFQSDTVEEAERTEEPLEQEVGETKVKTKKKKKRTESDKSEKDRKVELDEEPAYDLESPDVGLQGENVEMIEKSGKKKKWRDVGCDNSAATTEDVGKIVEENSSSKKKKKQRDTECEVAAATSEEAEEIVEENSSNKKKKKQRDTECEVAVATSEKAEENSSYKKKKKHRDTKSDDAATTSEAAEEIVEENGSKKKKDKHGDTTCDDVEARTGNVEQIVEENGPKKKKNKHKEECLEEIDVVEQSSSKKKRKSKTSDAQNEDSVLLDETENELKKHKRRKEITECIYQIEETVDAKEEVLVDLPEEGTQLVKVKKNKKSKVEETECEEEKNKSKKRKREEEVAFDEDGVKDTKRKKNEEDRLEVQDVSSPNVEVSVGNSKNSEDKTYYSSRSARRRQDMLQQLQINKFKGSNLKRIAGYGNIRQSSEFRQTCSVNS